jgi:hypothetical protein
MINTISILAILYRTTLASDQHNPTDALNNRRLYKLTIVQTRINQSHHAVEREPRKRHDKQPGNSRIAGQTQSEATPEVHHQSARATDIVHISGEEDMFVHS